MVMKRLLAIAFLPATLFACVYDDEPPKRLAPDPHPYEEAPAGSNTGNVPTGGSNGDTAPAPANAGPSLMLVEVDTDQTMTADPGQGVGVFTEYSSGGHWHIWWTCDTAKTGQRCDFSVSISTQSGNITNADASALTGGLMTTPTSSSINASITTGNEVHGLKFDTNPGAIVTLKATLDGVPSDGSFLFFVQNGKVNGGFSGVLTNPLQLQGKTP